MSDLNQFLKDKKDGMTLAQAKKVYPELPESILNEVYAKEVESNEDILDIVKAIISSLQEVRDSLDKSNKETRNAIKEIVIPEIPNEISVVRPNWYKEPPSVVKVDNLGDLKFPKQNEIKFPEIPEFPKEIEVKKPNWYKEFDFKKFRIEVKTLLVELFDILKRNLWQVEVKNRIPIDVNVVNERGQVIMAGGGGGADTQALYDIRTELKTINSLIPLQYDYIELSYTESNLTTVIYKSGGSGGITVATLSLAYAGSNLISVTGT